MPDRGEDDLLWATIAAAAPGTELRDGLERILRGRTGALIVLGHDKTVERMCTGGFPIDVDFSAPRLRELAKMDGAVVLDRDMTRIVRAATQLLPDADIETSESGTRHRTAERVARQTGFPVIAVSQSMQIVALYVGGRRHVLETSTNLLAKARQALSTLERYKSRLNEVTATLTALEVEDFVTVRDVALVLQRHEMVRRISREIEGYVLELGTEGRLPELQLEELMGGVGAERSLVVFDYLQDDGWRTLEGTLTALDALTSSELLDLTQVAAILGYPGSTEALDQAAETRGQRLLAKIPRLPRSIADRLLDHFGGLQPLLIADISDLMGVDGVGETRARAVREGLSRLAEASLLERYA